MDFKQEPTHWRLALAGELDFAQCPLFRRQIDNILKTDPLATVIDLSRLDYIDSSGLGILMVIQKDYSAAGRRLVLITNKTVDRLLAILRLDTYFAIARNMDQALRLLGGNAALL